MLFRQYHLVPIANNNFISTSYGKFLFKSNKQTKKPVNCFLHDDASASIQSLQTAIEIKLPKPMERTIEYGRLAEAPAKQSTKTPSNDLSIFF